MSFLLDAGVLSQPAQQRGDGRSKESGPREALQKWLRQLLDAMEGRVLGFGVAVAQVWAERQRALDQAAVRMSLAVSYSAATARRHGLMVVTGNDRDYRRPGVKVLNPFKELA